MTVTSGSSGGGSSSSDGKKDKISSVSKGTGITTTTDGGTPPAAFAGADLDKASNTRGTGEIKITPADTSIVSGASSMPPDAHGGSENGGVGEGRLQTTVTQTPTPEKSNPIPPAGTDGAEGTTITNGPRSDFSVVLAGQVGKRPERSAARSNNFVSLVGGAGGLGRKTSGAKRSLIGGA